MSESKYPEHEKLSAVRDRSQELGEFLEWLQSKKIVLSQYEDNESIFHERALFPVQRNTESILAEYFGIDLKVLESEKRAMLREISGSQEVQP